MPCSDRHKRAGGRNKLLWDTSYRSASTAGWDGLDSRTRSLINNIDSLSSSYRSENNFFFPIKKLLLANSDEELSFNETSAIKNRSSLYYTFRNGGTES